MSVCFDSWQFYKFYKNFNGAKKIVYINVSEIEDEMRVSDIQHVSSLCLKAHHHPCLMHVMPAHSGHACHYPGILGICSTLYTPASSVQTAAPG